MLARILLPANAREGGRAVNVFRGSNLIIRNLKWLMRNLRNFTEYIISCNDFDALAIEFRKNLQTSV